MERQKRLRQQAATLFWVASLACALTPAQAQPFYAPVGQREPPPSQPPEFLHQLNDNETPALTSTPANSGRFKPAAPTWTTSEGIWSINQPGVPCLLQPSSTQRTSITVAACHGSN